MAMHWLVTQVMLQHSLAHSQHWELHDKCNLFQYGYTQFMTSIRCSKVLLELSSPIQGEVIANAGNPATDGGNIGVPGHPIGTATPTAWFSAETSMYLTSPTGSDTKEATDQDVETRIMCQPPISDTLKWFVIPLWLSLDKTQSSADSERNNIWAGRYRICGM